MQKTFFFYDLETTGVSPRNGRVMQFAGQRTTIDLEPVGEPVNVMIKLTPDVLPDPDAILITGITPQQTIQDGYTEAEFLRLFCEEVAVAGTIFIGYNTIRFDDEFMRFMLYRNFYDAYEWQWQDDRGRWDLLDVIRMTRALRPDGIQWPFAPDGRPSNRLEYLTTLNKLDHESAHDALSDVHATKKINQSFLIFYFV
jgi:exodeoxyribonuclease-1